MSWISSACADLFSRGKERESAMKIVRDVNNTELQNMLNSMNGKSAL
jgi:hypothetical protein